MLAGGRPGISPGTMPGVCALPHPGVDGAGTGTATLEVLPRWSFLSLHLLPGMRQQPHLAPPQGDGYRIPVRGR